MPRTAHRHNQPQFHILQPRRSRCCPAACAACSSSAFAAEKPHAEITLGLIPQITFPSAGSDAAEPRWDWMLNAVPSMISVLRGPEFVNPLHGLGSAVCRASLPVAASTRCAVLYSRSARRDKPVCPTRKLQRRKTRRQCSATPPHDAELGSSAAAAGPSEACPAAARPRAIANPPRATPPG